MNFRFLFPRHRLAVATLAVALACGGDITGGGVTTQPPGGNQPPSGTPPNIEPAPVNGGNGQTGLTGTTLPVPLKVLVTRSGNALSGQTVTWATTGGSVAPTSAKTDANGNASTVWTLGPAVGTQTATASLPGATGSPVTFTATATASGGGGSPNTIQLTGIQFSPSTLTVAAGTTVTFEWVSNSHSVVSDGPPSFTDDRAISAPPHSLAVKFDTPGIYNFHCSVHGSPGAGMHGTITVQ